jgi:hypothetical protein
MEIIILPAGVSCPVPPRTGYDTYLLRDNFTMVAIGNFPQWPAAYAAGCRARDNAMRAAGFEFKRGRGWRSAKPINPQPKEAQQ